MKKDTLRLGVIAVAVLIAYNFAVFMIPCLKTPVFWISWGYTLLSFVVGGYAVYTALIRDPDAKSRFYGFPIARIGVVYLIAQVTVGGIFMALGHIVPWWLAVVVFTIGLALTVVGLVSAEAVVDQIQQQDGKLKSDVVVMRGLQSRVNSMVSQCADEDTAAAVKAFAEELRYSDPVSSVAIAQAERELCAVVDELQTAVVDGDAHQIKLLCRKASAALAGRNRLCKLNK